MRINLLGFVLSSLTLVGIVNGQAAPSQSGEKTSLGASVPSSAALTPSNIETQPLVRGASTPDSASPLPDLRQLPPAKATLIGGNLEKLDQVRDQLTLRPFGGGWMKILFDARTHVYRDGKPASSSDLKTGERVYIDTILDGTTIFARNIRFNTDTSGGESQGAVLSYHPDRAELLVRDALSPEPLRMHLTSSTHFLLGDRSASVSELAPGTLVAVKFDSDKDGRDVAREISILALPGATFNFAGQVVALNLRTGLLVLTSVTDRKTYEIYFDPSVISVDSDLRQGADVTVLTRFDGTRYLAQNVTINSPSKP